MDWCAQSRYPGTRTPTLTRKYSSETCYPIQYSSVSKAMVVEDEHIIMSGRCACHSREPGSEVHCFVTNIHLPWHSNAWVGFYHNSFLVLYLSHKSILLSMSTSRVFSNCKCTLIVACQGLQLTKTFSPRLLFNGGTIPFVISINIERPQQYIVFS